MELQTCEKWAEIRADLCKIGRALHRLGEQQCNGFQKWNGDWDEEATNRADRREEKLIKRAEEIAKRYGLAVYHQGDPRGAALYVYDPADLAEYQKRHAGTATPESYRPGIDACYDSIGHAMVER